MKSYIFIVCIASCSLSIARADTPMEDDHRVLIDRRTEDIRRTQNRIDGLIADTQHTEKNLKNAQLEVAKIQRELGKRARFMYKLNRRGGSFRYLITADSVLSLLKRAGILKRFINDELTLLRARGRAVAELSNRLNSNELELKKAKEMHSRLEETLADLKKETR